MGNLIYINIVYYIPPNFKITLTFTPILYLALCIAFFFNGQTSSPFQDLTKTIQSQLSGTYFFLDLFHSSLHILYFFCNLIRIN